MTYIVSGGALNSTNSMLKVLLNTSQSINQSIFLKHIERHWHWPSPRFHNVLHGIAMKSSSSSGFGDQFSRWYSITSITNKQFSMVKHSYTVEHQRPPKQSTVPSTALVRCCSIGPCKGMAPWHSVPVKMGLAVCVSELCHF